MADPAEGRSLPDQEGSPAVAYIARCPEHGLHGERDDCFVCGEPVAMIGYVRADLHLQVHSARGRHEAEARRLRGENETLKEEQVAFVRALEKAQTEVEALRELYTEENEERAKAQAEVKRLREALKPFADQAGRAHGWLEVTCDDFKAARSALAVDENHPAPEEGS